MILTILSSSVQSKITELTGESVTARQAMLVEQSLIINEYDLGSDAKDILAHALWSLYKDEMKTLQESTGSTGVVLERQTDSDRIKFADRSGSSTSTGSFWGDMLNELLAGIDEGLSYADGRE